MTSCLGSKVAMDLMCKLVDFTSKFSFGDTERYDSFSGSNHSVAKRSLHLYWANGCRLKERLGVLLELLLRGFLGAIGRNPRLKLPSMIELPSFRSFAQTNEKIEVKERMV